MRRLVVVAIGMFVNVAHAGMLVTQSFSMLDTWQAGGFVVDGVVVGVKGNKIDVDVKRVFLKTGDSEPESKWVGSVHALSLTPPVQWTDEHVSPLETRLYGEVDAVRAGDEVLFVVDTRRGDYKALPATPAALRAATIIFDDAERAKYVAAPRAVLEKDLADDHLAGVALAALRHAGGPSTAALLGVRYDLLRGEYAAMSPSARKRFLGEAAPLVKSDPKARNTLASLAFSDVRIDPATIPELAAVAAGLDASVDADRSSLGRLYHAVAVLAPASSADLSPLAPAVAAAFLARGPSPRDDDDLPRIVARMSPAAQTTLAKALQAGAQTSREAKRTGGVDREALAQAQRILSPPDLSAFVEESFTLAPGAKHACKSGVVFARLRDPPVIGAECASQDVFGGGSLSFTTPVRYREWYACGYLVRISDVVDATPGPLLLSLRAVPQALPPAELSFSDASAIGDKALAAAGCKASNSTEQDVDRGFMKVTSSDQRCVAILGRLSHEVVRVDALPK